MADSPGFAPFIALLRPRQWTKNGVVLAAAIFSGTVADPQVLSAALGATLLFCLAAGACYAINDVVDAERDRRHPSKRSRPVASGRVGPRAALLFALLLLSGVLALSLLLPRGYLVSLVAYLLLTNAYTLWLKSLAILDVLVVALGFVLRAVAGAFAVGVVASPWLLLCAAFLALFLGFAKRRQELVHARQDTRESLSAYSVPLLDQILTVVITCTLMSYCLYTVLSPQTRWLMLTIPFVLYGVFRYQLLVHRQGAGEAPERVLLEDAPLRWTVAAWLATVLAVLYA